MTEDELKNIVAFCALMQNRGGIIDKSPDYIEEKFARYCRGDSVNHAYRWGLDDIRTDILNRWEERWLKKGEDDGRK